MNRQRDLAEIQGHPAALEQAALAEGLAADVAVVTTEEIFAGITYQPLNLGETIGQVRIVTIAELETGYVSPREIAVLDRVPNDISVVAGTVTEEFQTPLAHVNVLAQQRGTPNMALVGAQTAFAPYAGQWVHLTVASFGYTVAPATQAEADAWFEAHRPPAVQVPALDGTRVDLVDVDDLGLDQLGSYGGKACGFGLLRDIEGIAVRDGFAIPFFYYDQFMRENAFDVEIDALLADPMFTGDGTYRRAKLLELQGRMEVAPINTAFHDLLFAKLNAEYPNLRMRYRSSTNAEDLNGQIGAGLYESKSGDPDDPADTVEDAIRKVWASMWNFRAFEEREYLRIPHDSVAMAMLVHESYVAEAANGVAVTANIFDPAAGGEDAFYVNVQVGDGSVTRPLPGITAEQLIYYYFHPGQPATYLALSNLVAPGEHVMSREELYDLGQQLDKIRTYLLMFYDPPSGFGALPLEVDFKLVLDPDGTRHVEVKQARPYPGR
jgi:hypothetical protein